jgi:hypothetical protein
MTTATVSTYLAGKIIDLLFNDSDFDPSSGSIYVSLHSADPGATGASELSGNAYARVAVADWDAASSKATANGAVINFPTATDPWSEATHFGIWDAATAGNFWLGGELTAGVTIAAGEAARYDAGDLDVAIT